MVELRRKFYDRLMQWKNTRHQESLLVKGARQIGKTFIIEKFGREQYESFIEFNFILDPDACSIFDGSLKAEDLYRKISAYDASRRLLPGRTLIFLDEIQECANARTALKSFALDGRYDVVASGVTITPEREKAFLFTKPYYDVQQIVVLKKGAENTFKKPKKVRNKK